MTDDRRMAVAALAAVAESIHIDKLNSNAAEAAAGGSLKPDFGRALKHINEAAAAAVVVVCMNIQLAYEKTIPADRVKTRRAIKTRLNKSERQGRVGVFFPASQRVDPEGTITKKLCKQAWNSVKRQAEQLLVNSLRRAVETAPFCFKYEI